MKILRRRPGHCLGLLLICLLIVPVLAACAPMATAPATTTPPSPAPAATPTPQPPAVSYARITTSSGKVVYVKLEVAATAQERSVGLSKRSSLPPDAGMIFLFPADHQSPFWMKDTWIPLSIAFITADGRIVEIQDMEPNTETYHMPRENYRNALEVNKGFFDNNGIKAGDRVELQLGGR